MWIMSIIPVLRKLRQEDHEFQASLSYRARPSLKTNKTETTTEYLGDEGIAHW
jgi:hypothetical protein